METTTNLEVANIISEQIGKQAFFLMGSRYLMGDEKSLSFDIRGSRKWNKIQVTLMEDDTYTVEFMKLGRFAITARESVSDVYAEQLRDVIEHNTGLYLSLGGRR